MAAQIFPEVETLLKILLSELPEGVYADDLADDADPAKRSVSSSEMRAAAQMLSNLYDNLSDVNSDKFISTITIGGLPYWEKQLFTSAQDSSQSFDTRKANLLAKIRANGGISLPAIHDVVAGVLGSIPFEIITYCGMADDGNTGGWVLDQSPLDEGTFLGLLDPIRGAGRDPGIVPLDCNLNFGAAGISAQDLLDIQATAYTYEVRVFGNASSATLSLLDKQLTALEPARSAHVITNNAPAPIDPNLIPANVWPILYGQ